MQAVFDTPMAAHEGRQPFGIGLSRGQAGEEDDLDAAQAAAFIDTLPLEAKDLLQAGPTAILGGQGVGSVQGAHFNATAVQVVRGCGDRLGDDLRISEQGGDVVTQGGLVGFGGQDIVTTLGDDLLNDRFLGQLGVASDDPARQIEPFQQGQGGADLVTVADGALGQDDPHLGGEGRQQLHGVLAALPAAAHRLTVQRQRTQTR